MTEKDLLIENLALLLRRAILRLDQDTHYRFIETVQDFLRHNEIKGSPLRKGGD